MMNNTKVLLLVAFIVIFSGCNTRPNQPELSLEQRRELAIQKSISGDELFQRYLLLDSSESLFYQALDSLNAAIKYDSTYAQAYHIKAGMLAEVDSLDTAIKVLDQLISKDSTEVMAIMLQGFYYERMRDSLKARNKYIKATRVYERKIKNNPDDVFSKAERAFLFLFTYSKEKALKEISKVIQAHPTSELAKNYKEIIQTFNRKEFIKSQ